MSEPKSDPKKRRYFLRFLSYALDYKGLLLLCIFMALAKGLPGYVFPWLSGEAVDTVISPRMPMSLEERESYLWMILGFGVLFSVLHSVAAWCRGFFTAKLGNRIIADIRQDLFDHLHQLSLHFYSKERTGSIVSRLINDIQQASQLVNGGVISVVMDTVQMAVGLFLLFRISVPLTFAALVVLPFYGLTYRKLNPRVKLAAMRVQSQISKISGNVQERLAGIALIKSYTAESRESESFRAETEEHFDRVIEQSTFSQLIGAISEFLVHIGQFIVIGVGGWFVLHNKQDLTAGDFWKFMGTLAVMYLPVRRFSEVNVLYQTSLAAIQRVFEVFDITPKIVEKPTAVTTTPPKGAITFEGVQFDYTDDSDEARGLERDTPRAALEKLDKNAEEIAAKKRGQVVRRWVLDGVDFTVAPGEKVALVGPSGSGKTTIVSLLPRLYDVTSGRIQIDGVDVRDYRLRTLRRAIGIVQQDSFLFSGTVRENIAYGRPKATDEEVIQAAMAANAHDFIMGLPDNYLSRLGERGVNLSGGQRQRISIARAVLKNPKILILDEATSALDSESESLVQQALDRLVVGRTCLIIAHRLSTVRNADRILVMQAGKIVESGSHEQLLGTGGLYARLVRQQFGVAFSAA